MCARGTFSGSTIVQALFCAAAAAAPLVVSFASTQDPMGSDAKAQGNHPTVAGHAHQNADHAQSKCSEVSRYHRHNDRWWYWMPDRSWVVRPRGRWVPYQAGMFTDGSMATRQPAWRFSYNSQSAYSYAYPRLDQSPSAYGLNPSIRNAASKVPFN
jgi:hypothetical protein